MDRGKLEGLALRTLSRIRKPVRCISGITVVAVMAKPYPCPHGRCAYCPGGVEIGTPQSYMSDSPAVLRALRCGFDPYEQVRSRLKTYISMGHNPSKVELIIMGGTFPAMPLDYQEWFVAQALEALNRFPRNKPQGWVGLEEAQRRNERSAIRCVGLTIESRPDWALERHVDGFLRLGATRVELGVQSIYDEVLRRVDRGHGVRESIRATRALKDAGYKVVYHMMPGLPGSDLDKDYAMFKEIFNNPSFRPDMLKIYPTLVIPGTKLYEMWKRGVYKPYSLEELLELLIKVMKIIPRYVRVMRIQRDIPVHHVAAGLRVGNLRELLEKELSARGIKSGEIRAREVGHVLLKRGIVPDEKDVKLCRMTYEASGGTEVFLSVEDVKRDILIGFLRLRIPSSKAHRWEVDERTAIVRELHVYGPEVPVGERGLWWQHRGYGSLLLREAERIALEEFGESKMLIISGVGVREYYRKRGYRKLKGSFYMYKRLH